jgi:glyoxylase-like metal-dependent hydrolase (beta-lactamase superfamily II)
VILQEKFGSVTRIQLSSLGSRLAGMHVSVYLVRGVMIDSGFPRAWPELQPALAALGVRGATVTHWHEDHAGNVAPLARLGVPLAMHPDTASILRDPARILPYRRVVWGTPEPLPSFEPFDDPTLQRIHTPGHSPEHHVVWDTQEGTLFSGDLWLGVRARIMHEHEDPRQIVQSLRTVLSLGPARMFDAHRGEVTNPVAAIQAKIDWMTDTIGTIEQRIGEGWSDRMIVRRVLGGEERAAYASRGEYSRRNFVRAVRSGREVRV